MGEKNKLKLFVGAIKAIEEVLKKLNDKINLSDDKPDCVSKNRCLVGIDYDNIRSILNKTGEQFDFSGFINKLAEMGFKVYSPNIFIPYESYYILPKDLNNLGYKIVICQKMERRIQGAWKREDLVDSRMQLDMGEFFECDNVTHVVILTHDVHSIELLTEAIKNGKKVMYFADKNEMSLELVKVITEFKIPIYPLPRKNKVLY